MTTQADRTRVIRSIDIAASPEAAYDALTRPELLAQWLAEEVELDPRVGGRFRFSGPSVLENEVSGAVVLIAPNHFAFSRPLLGRETVVDVRVKPEGSGCRVQWDHSLPGNEKDYDWYIAMDQANLALYNLRGFLEEGRPACPAVNTAEAGTVRVTVTADAPPEDVWAALTVPEKMDVFLSNGAKVDLRVGGEYTYGWQENGVDGGPTRLLDLDPGRRLVTDWFYPGDSEGTQVTWEVSSEGGKTTVTLTHSGFAATDDIPGYVHGWAAFLGALKAMVEGRNLVRKGPALPPPAKRLLS